MIICMLYLACIDSRDYYLHNEPFNQHFMLYPRHTGGAVQLRCLYGINRSGTAMIAVIPQWFRH